MSETNYDQLAAQENAALKSELKEEAKRLCIAIAGPEKGEDLYSNIRKRLTSTTAFPYGFKNKETGEVTSLETTLYNLTGPGGRYEYIVKGQDAVDHRENAALKSAMDEAVKGPDARARAIRQYGEGEVDKALRARGIAGIGGRFDKNFAPAPIKNTDTKPERKVTEDQPDHAENPFGSVGWSITKQGSLARMLIGKYGQAEGMTRLARIAGAVGVVPGATRPNKNY